MNHEFWINVFVVAANMLLSWWLFVGIKKRNAKTMQKYANEEHIVVRMPRIYLLLTIFAVLFLALILTLIVIHVKDGALVFGFFCVYAAISAMLILSACGWRIELNRSEDFFVYRTMFLKTYKIYYSECVSYTIGEYNSVTILTRTGKKIEVDATAVCRAILLAELDKYHVKKQIRLGFANCRSWRKPE